MGRGDAMTAAPSGVVTFLFTDIEGSTRRWESDAQSMRAALLGHDEVLRTAIEAHDGFVFSHTGDGVVAAFTSPRSAVDAAVAAQRALEMPVRMGIATGEAELRDGDYFGTVLNRAARVMAAGHGGQILLADSTAVLLSGVDLVDLGPRRLRDLPNPMTVFQLQAPGLRTDFPPLRTLDPTPGNLRPAITSLIGRDTEVSNIQAAVRSHRLVTLTGVGGVGKTRLAVEVAGQLADEFPDGVWFFELAAVTDPAAVPDAVAAVLGITQQPGKSVAESVAAALEGRVRLLVFDNCEHVRDAAADLVEAILAQSATVRILATSREGVGVADEQLWLVPSLDVGAGIDSAAVNLFVERARSVASGFSLANADEANAVVEICGRLDGIPLAIELAASRMASITPAEVRDRLDQRFRLLIGSRRGLARHQTLRHAVAWSYDLLDDAEKSLLTRCSVFAGGFDLQSACAVAGFDNSDEYAILDLLDVLVRKSLLTADRLSGRTRFSMLETIRQFADEQLVASGDATEVRTAHARHFAERESDILALWDSPRQRDAYDWLTTELANLRAAFRWSADHDDLDIAAAIASYAAFVGTWVEQHEPAGWAEELIAPIKAVEHRRLAQLYVMASSCYAVGRIADAVGYAEAGRLAIASGRFDKVFDEAGHGVAYMIGGQPERWVDWCRNMIARDQGADSYTRACLVVALTIAGASEEAIEASDGLSAAADATDNPAVVCYALLAYGFARRDADPIAAYEVVRRGLTIALDSGNRSVGSHLAVSLSRLAVAHGDPIDAFDFVELAIRNYYDSGSFSFLHSPLAILVTLFHRLGHYEPAATISGFAVNPLARAAFPEINSAIAHLRDILGDPTYESLARKGETMSTAAIATYAYDQIDQARAELNAVSK
jgi:predicted ATPase/class 3 adenylate cyclase